MLQSKTMEGFIVKVTTYHGEPQLVEKIPTRAEVILENPVIAGEVINDFDRLDTIVDVKASGKPADYNVDVLIDDFQLTHGCKIAYDDLSEVNEDGTTVFSFDVFEPSWGTPLQAYVIGKQLMSQLIGWTRGEHV